ncbi:hypothetical protein TNCV_405781 [Trichonephila clavipes]|nr:hypothetical protein TNCV_405781 [Trichonephila clavipes]
MNPYLPVVDTALPIAQVIKGRNRGLGRGPRLTSELRSPTGSPKILQCNINGLSTPATRTKLQQLIDIADWNGVQIVALQETKLTTRGLLATDHVVLNHGRVTWTAPELAPPSPNYYTNERMFQLSTDLACTAALHGGSLVVLGTQCEIRRCGSDIRPFDYCPSVLLQCCNRINSVSDAQFGISQANQGAIRTRLRGVSCYRPLRGRWALP